jgi:hypothetical protein
VCARSTLRVSERWDAPVGLLETRETKEADEADDFREFKEGLRGGSGGAALGTLGEDFALARGGDSS